MHNEYQGDRVKIENVLNGNCVISKVNDALYREIKDNWDHVAKPLDSLGKFENLLSKIGAIQGELHPQLTESRILVMCADNGIVEEGISQSDKTVTKICAGNIAAGKSSVGIMAKEAGIKVVAVDVGIDTEEGIPGILNRKIRKGTRNFHIEPAMRKEEVLQALQTGMDLVAESMEAGCRILGMGEMGIGNTTTSSAVAAALLGETAEHMTGRGAGLDDERLLHKKNIIAEAIERYKLYSEEPLKVLETVGGLDIAALAGVCIGGAVYHIPVVLDGFISMTAALVVCRLVPEVKDYLIPSHSSKEPAVVRLQQALELEPVLDAHMALGEGTGAVLMISLLKTVAAVYESSVSFSGTGIEQYTRY